MGYWHYRINNYAIVNMIKNPIHIEHVLDVALEKIILGEVSYKDYVTFGRMLNLCEHGGMDITYYRISYDEFPIFPTMCQQRLEPEGKCYECTGLDTKCQEYKGLF